MQQRGHYLGKRKIMKVTHKGKEKMQGFNHFGEEDL